MNNDKKILDLIKDIKSSADYYVSYVEAYNPCAHTDRVVEKLLKSAEELRRVYGSNVPKKDLGSLDIMFGANTNQPWVYANGVDRYIDPPKAVLDELTKKYGYFDYDSIEAALQEIVDKDPDWLYDEAYWYDDIEI